MKRAKTLNNLNFHQIMVKICDDFKRNHTQQLALRTRITDLYKTAGRQGISLEQLASLAYHQFKANNDPTNLTDEEWIELAKKVKILHE